LKDQMMKKVIRINQKKVVSLTHQKNLSTTKTVVSVNKLLMLMQFLKQPRRCLSCKSLLVIKKRILNRRMKNHHQMKMKKMICLLHQMKVLMIIKHSWNLSANPNKIGSKK